MTDSVLFTAGSRAWRLAILCLGRIRVARAAEPHRRKDKTGQPPVARIGYVHGAMGALGAAPDTIRPALNLFLQSPRTEVACVDKILQTFTTRSRPFLLR